ncbi:MAG: insulinase family protein, partial [Gemmatimonadetes bacterium]|nr:insulinase family protein [Gemmatimonadota bacterium]
LNAFTSYDATAYIVSLPANRLELWTILESDRFKKPVLREFYTEVENVREERRLSVEDNPGALLYERLTATAYDAHRYGVEIIGWDSEIRTINRSEVEDYYRRYYAPNQMIIAVSGDVDPAETVAMIDAYFGDYDRQPPPHPVQTEEPEQLGEKRLEVEYDAEPRILMAWHKPTVGHPDNAALTVARHILDNGLSSRFERNIVNKGIAASISAGVDNPGERYPNLFTVSATVQSPHTVADVERAILFEMDRLKTEPVTAAELEKAKTQIETAYVRSFGSNMRSAINIAYEEAVLGNWMRRPESILACREVTAEDVQRVANTYFKKQTRTVGYTVKPEEEELESAMGGTR